MENINKINAIIKQVNAVSSNENLTLDEKDAQYHELMQELDAVVAEACSTIDLDYASIKAKAIKELSETNSVAKKLMEDPKVKEALENMKETIKEIPVPTRRRKPAVLTRIVGAVAERVHTFRKSNTADKLGVAVPIILGGAYLLMRRKADQKALAAVGASYLAQEAMKWVCKGLEELETLNDNARKELVEMQAAAKA